MKRPVPIFLFGPENWQVSHIFNPNAFPKHAKNLVFPCMDCLSMFILSVNQVEQSIKIDKKQFLRQLRGDRAFEGFTPNPNQPCIVVYHNARFLVALHLVLYSMKSFLDVYAQLVSKLIVPNSTVFGFNEGIVEGKRLKGGRLINWLKRSSPRTFINANELGSLIKQHAFSWINEAVDWRDNLIHYAELPNLRPMMVLSHCEPRWVKAHHIIPPQMPNKKDVVTYCNETRKNLFHFIKESFLLLPDINFELVSLDILDK